MSQLFNLEKPELIGLVLFWTVPVSYMLNMCRICNSCCCLLRHQAGWLINTNIRFEKLYLCNTNTSVSKVFSFLTVVAHCYCEYCTFTWSDSPPDIFITAVVIRNSSWCASLCAAHSPAACLSAACRLDSAMGTTYLLSFATEKLVVYSDCWGMFCLVFPWPV